MPIIYRPFTADNEPSDSFTELEILQVLRLFVALPSEISNAKRSFNVLRRIKNYLRFTTEQQRTSDLALLATERKTARQLDYLVAS